MVVSTLCFHITWMSHLLIRLDYRYLMSVEKNLLFKEIDSIEVVKNYKWEIRTNSHVNLIQHIDFTSFGREPCPRLMKVLRVSSWFIYASPAAIWKILKWLATLQTSRVSQGIFELDWDLLTWNCLNIPGDTSDSGPHSGLRIRLLGTFSWKFSYG